MAQGDVELLLGLHGVLEVDDSSHLGDSCAEVREFVGCCDDGSFDVLRVEPCDADTYSVPLLGRVDWFSEHLDRFHLLGLTQLRDLDLVSARDFALKDSPC